jgi:hypothetical protein
MDLEEVRKIVERLDASVSKENARVAIYRYGGGDDESSMVATRNGYLRLGIEFLKGGISPISLEPLPTVIDVDVHYLMDTDSTVYFDMFELTEKLPEKESERSLADTAVIYSITGFFLVVIPILAIVGLIAIFRLLL